MRRRTKELAAELRQHIDNTIPDMLQDDKLIYCPLSGGLDSRVLAKLINIKWGKIDLGMCYYNDDYYEHVDLVGDLLFHIDYDNFQFINVRSGLTPQERAFEAYEELSKRVNLSKYRSYQPLNWEFYTGIHIGWSRWTKRSLDRFEDKYLATVPMDQYNTQARYFARYGLCYAHLNEVELQRFCLNLPTHYRFNQYLYRQMIKLYMPDIAGTPRDERYVAPDQNEWEHLKAYAKWTWKKYRSGKLVRN